MNTFALYESVTFFYHFSQELDEALKICNYIFTLIFVLESVFKLVAFGFRRFFKDKSVYKSLASSPTCHVELSYTDTKKN